MVTVRPGREQKFAGSRRCAAGSTHTDARMGARARACDTHGHAGARGEGATVTVMSHQNTYECNYREAQLSEAVN